MKKIYAITSVALAVALTGCFSGNKSDNGNSFSKNSGTNSSGQEIASNVSDTLGMPGFILDGVEFKNPVTVKDLENIGYEIQDEPWAIGDNCSALHLTMKNESKNTGLIVSIVNLTGEESDDFSNFYVFIVQTGDVYPTKNYLQDTDAYNSMSSADITADNEISIGEEKEAIISRLGMPDEWGTTDSIPYIQYKLPTYKPDEEDEVDFFSDFVDGYVGAFFEGDTVSGIEIIQNVTYIEHYARTGELAPVSFEEAEDIQAITNVSEAVLPLNSSVSTKEDQKFVLLGEEFSKGVTIGDIENLGFTIKDYNEEEMSVYDGGKSFSFKPIYLVNDKNQEIKIQYGNYTGDDDASISDYSIRSLTAAISPETTAETVLDFHLENGITFGASYSNVVNEFGMSSAGNKTAANNITLIYESKDSETMEISFLNEKVYAINVVYDF